MNIAVIAGASSGLGVKFLEAVMKRYPRLDAKDCWKVILRKLERASWRNPGRLLYCKKEW